MSAIIKVGLRKTDVRLLAQAYGIPWTDWLVDRIEICENEIMRIEIENLNAKEK